MNKHFLILLTVLAAFSLHAQVVPSGYERVSEYDPRGLAAVRKSGKYGIVNREGEFVVPCEFSAIGSFNPQGFIWVNKGGRCNMKQGGLVTGGKYGVYDRKGNVIIQPQYKAIGTFIELNSLLANPFAKFNYLPAEYRPIVAEVNKYKVYLYDYVQSTLFSKIDMSFDSLIVISEKADHVGDGIVRPDGSIMMPIGLADLIFRPEEGIIPTGVMHNNELYANYFMPERQSFMFQNPIKVDCITPFHNGYAVLATRGANQFITSLGEKIGSPYQIILPSSDGSYIVVANSKYGLANSQAEEIIKPEYEIIHPAKEDLMLAFHTYGGPASYLTPDGREAITTDYKEASSFKFNTAAVKDENGWGLINKEGKLIVKCRWYEVKNPSQADCPLVWVKAEENGNYYCINIDNDSLVFEESFAEVENFSERFPGIAFVYGQGQLVGCINSKGVTVIPCLMDDITSAINEYRAMLNDGVEKWSFMEYSTWTKRYNASKDPFSLNYTLDNTIWDY